MLLLKSLVYNNMRLTHIQTDAEYMEQYMTYRRRNVRQMQGNFTKLYNPTQYPVELPESVDWRTNNAVTDVKDQV